MQDKATRTTPEPIARQLRQEAAFGCCRCGYPIIQYHHIVPFSSDHHFRPDDMMVLCPNCHDAANNGAITTDEQRRLKSKPYNVKRGYAAELLTVNHKTLQLLMGSNTFIGGGSIIQADKEVLVALNLNPQGSVELTVKLYNQLGQQILLINKNEWLSGSLALWDIEASCQKLKVREKKGRIAIDLNLKQIPARIQAHLWCKGHLISILPSSLRMDQNELDCQFIKCVFRRYGLSFRTCPEPAIEIVPALLH